MTDLSSLLIIRHYSSTLKGIRLVSSFFSCLVALNEVLSGYLPRGDVVPLISVGGELLFTSPVVLPCEVFHSTFAFFEFFSQGFLLFDVFYTF